MNTTHHTTHPTPAGCSSVWVRTFLAVSLLALATPAVAQISLFEAERFEGHNLSVQRRLPDLARSGYEVF